FRKLVVPFISTGYSHDRSSSISNQHIFTDPDRYFFSVEWMKTISPGKNATNLFFCHPFPFTAALHISYVFPNSLFLFSSSYLIYQVMFRRDHHKVNSKDGIRASSIDTNSCLT